MLSTFQHEIVVTRAGVLRRAKALSVSYARYGSSSNMNKCARSTKELVHIAFSAYS